MFVAGDDTGLASVYSREEKGQRQEEQRREIIDCHVPRSARPVVAVLNSSRPIIKRFVLSKDEHTKLSAAVFRAILIRPERISIVARLRVNVSRNSDGKFIRPALERERETNI